MAYYGEEIKLDLGETVEFPDFAITHVRDGEIKNPKFISRSYRVFRVCKDTQCIEVKHNFGGILMPTDFEFGEKVFWLEIGYSFKRKKRMEGEGCRIAIWDDPEYGKKYAHIKRYTEEELKKAIEADKAKLREHMKNKLVKSNNQ